MIKKTLVTAAALAVVVAASNCTPKPIVRVTGDVGGGPDARSFDVNSYFSDMTNDYFDGTGVAMGGRISTIANFSDKTVMFGTRPDGWFGHGGSICVGPQTWITNLADYHCEFGTCTMVCDPDPYGSNTCWALCSPGGNGDDHCNANDQIWSYLGPPNDPLKDCGTLADGFYGGNNVVDLSKY